MAKLNGYWISKTDPNVTVYVEKVYKKGYVTGFKYMKVADGEIHSRFKATFDELLDQYERKG
ncbi:hypothetical protein [Geobacillus phage TP-84]|uniref:Uncharacterized protein n=1 Tax=Geobacillus phage TP-84 TaxID=1965361 RepID=A0A1U9WQN5_9CAUD|nr:hypothetical protein MUK65_gp77 [Geobacillus phage TP-84]AQY55094.1 hypothetical protein [Geobacillus phage TP-84]